MLGQRGLPLLRVVRERGGASQVAEMRGGGEERSMSLEPHGVEDSCVVRKGA